MVGTGYSQRTQPTRAPTDPTFGTSKPTQNPVISQGGCIDGLIQSANSSNRQYIVIPKRGQNRLKFLKRFLRDRAKTVAISGLQSDPNDSRSDQPGRGSGRDLPVVVISAEEAEKVSYTSILRAN